jgi:hypothetical protein
MEKLFGGVKPDSSIFYEEVEEEVSVLRDHDVCCYDC